MNRTYNKLCHSIYTGRLRPGQRLVESQLAQQMGTSRIPLRESLIRLEAEGLIRSVPNSATFVEHLDPQDVLEIYSMRLALEPLATRLAAVRCDGRSIRRLERLCEQMIDDVHRGDLGMLDQTDYEFHLTVAKASGHRRLLRAYKTSHILVVGPYVTAASISQDTVIHHRQIIDFIKRRDADGAETFAREHVTRSLRSIEKHLGMTLDGLSSHNP